MIERDLLKQAYEHFLNRRITETFRLDNLRFRVFLNASLVNNSSKGTWQIKLTEAFQDLYQILRYQEELVPIYEQCNG